MIAVTTLKNRIKDVLKDQGITPYRLAILLGKPHQNVYTVVNAEALDNRDLITVDEIANVLQVPITDLYERVD